MEANPMANPEVFAKRALTAAYRVEQTLNAAHMLAKESVGDYDGGRGKVTFQLMKAVVTSVNAAREGADDVVSNVRIVKGMLAEAADEAAPTITAMDNWRQGYDDGKHEGAKAVLRLMQIEFGQDQPDGIPAKVEARLEMARGKGYQDGYAAAAAEIREAKFEAFQHGRQVEREEAEKAAVKPDAVGAGDYDVGVQAGWDLALRRVKAGTASTNPPDMAAAIAHLRECVIDEVLGGLEFDTRDLAVAPVELARRLGEADRYAQGVCDGTDYALAELGWPEMTIEDAKDAKSKRGQEILEDGKRAGQNLTLSELGFKAGDLAGAVAAVQALKDRRAGIGRDDIIDEVLAALGFGGMTIEEAQICRRHEQEEANEVVQAAAQALDPEGPYAAGMKHVLTALGWGHLELGDAVSRKSKLTIDAAFAHNKPLPSDDHSVRFRDGEAAGVRAALLRLGFTGMTLDEAAQAAQELRARDPGSDPILSQLPADRPLLQVLVEIGATAQLGQLEGHHGRIDRANAIREAVMATEVVWRRDVAANRDMGAASNYGADKQQEVRNA